MGDAGKEPTVLPDWDLSSIDISLFFHSWGDIIRTLVVGALAYAGLVLTLRISGKRTLSKMNAFDLVVTVALGSTLATILLSKEVSLAEGLTAYATLIGLQYLVAWFSTHARWFSRMVKSEPRLLFRDGEFLERAMRKERVTREEVVAAIRAQGRLQTSAAAVVLETDGSFSVLSGSGKPAVETATALEGVRGVEGGTS